MNRDLSHGLHRLFARVAELAASEAEFRAEVRSFAETLISAVDQADVDEVLLSDPLDGEAEAPTTSDAVASDHTPPDDNDHELQGIAARCRLKAEGCGWAAERFRLKQQGADHQLEIAPGDQEIVEKGRTAGCYLWMNCRTAPVPADPSLYDTLAGCFHALAAALDVVCSIEGRLSSGKFLLNEAVTLLAEAQSALRAGIKLLQGPSDPDQVEAFQWLREKCAENRQFIERHMREDDPADPASWPDLLDRIADLDLRVEEAIHTERRQRKLLNKLRYQVGRLETEKFESDHLWESIARTLDDVVREGTAPSDVQLREVLLPHVEEAPELDEPQGYKLVLREITAFLNSSGSSTSVPASEGTTPEIDEAARLLNRRAVVLIGGDARPERKEALEQAFQLSELIWVETTPGQSVATFEPYVARPEVAVVLLAIRWSSHSYSGVKRFCDRYDKPLVRLPAGYSPNQVAAHIMAQCSDRLADGSGEDAA